MLINTCVSSNYGIINPQLAVLPYLTRLVSFTLLPSFRHLLKIGTGAANSVDRRKAKGLHVEVVIVIAHTASDLCCWMVNCPSTQVCTTELSVVHFFPLWMGVSCTPMPGDQIQVAGDTFPCQAKLILCWQQNYSFMWLVTSRHSILSIK